MFTEQDYREYFEDIAIMERRMIFGLHALRLMTQDAFLIKATAKIWDDEIRHYGYACGMLSSLLGKDKVSQRKAEREALLGYVTLRCQESQKEFQAKCIDISAEGIGLEFDKEPPSGNGFDVSIQLFNEEKPRHAQGQLVWTKKIRSKLSIGYVGGLQLVA